MEMCEDMCSSRFVGGKVVGIPAVEDAVWGGTPESPRRTGVELRMFGQETL